MSKILEVIKKKAATDGATGPCTFTKYEDGTITYDRPGLRIPALSKPGPEWKARKEKASSTARRFKKSIEDANKKNDEIERMKRHYGKEHGNGWILTATDVHRALFERGSGEKAADDLNLTGFQRYKEAYCDDPEFHLAVKRALVMAPENTSQVKLIIENGTLSVRSRNKDPQCEGEFEQSLPISHTDDVEVRFNGKYLEGILGFWPLRMIWNGKKGKGGDDRWIFTAIGDEDEYRFVIMPMRG